MCLLIIDVFLCPFFAFSTISIGGSSIRTVLSLIRITHADAHFYRNFFLAFSTPPHCVPNLPLLHMNFSRLHSRRLLRAVQYIALRISNSFCHRVLPKVPLKLFYFSKERITFIYIHTDRYVCIYI